MLLTPPSPQPLFDVAVVVPTILRPSLLRAVRSIFTQDFVGRVQILIGVDIAQGDRGLLETLVAECPANMAVVVLDPGYSTSVRHGGLHTNQFSGALRTVLTYLAHSRHVAYLDDDNWFGPDHLSSLRAAIMGMGWAYSQRWFVDPDEDTPLVIDDWESVGIGAGVYAQQYGGFVDPSSLMIDKTICQDVAPLWSIAAFANGAGEDRLVFETLRTRHPGAATRRATSYYRMQEDDAVHLERLQKIREHGVTLARDRVAGVRSLAEVVARFRSSEPGIAVAPVDSDEILLRDVVQRLKPREIVILGATEPGVVLSALAREAGLPALTLVTSADAGAAAGDIVILPETITDPWAWLAAAGLAVDLSYVTAQAQPAEVALATAWAITRVGGLILGDEDSDRSEVLRDAAKRLGTTLHPATIGSYARWMIQKDR